MSENVTAIRFDTRDWPDQHLAALFSEGFPPFILADHDVKPLMGPVREAFGAFDIALVTDGDVPIAAGWGVPIAWDGEPASLPSGYTDSLRRAVDVHRAGGTPDTFVICAGIVHPDFKGEGIAPQLIGALVELAQQAGLAKVVAPLRPTLKHRYPLIDIDDYATWQRSDGLPFDPWVRLHVRSGGEVVGVAPESQTMTGTVAEWESWTDMAFPASGEYVIPEGLSVLRIDREQDRGVYVEPNIWVRHR